jgi:hypothetical protein
MFIPAWRDALCNGTLFLSGPSALRQCYCTELSLKNIIQYIPFFKCISLRSKGARYLTCCRSFCLHRLSTLCQYPLSTCNRLCLLNVRRYRRKVKILQMKAASSKSRFEVRNIYSGNFPVRVTGFQNSSGRARSFSYTWHAVDCSSVLRYLRMQL